MTPLLLAFALMTGGSNMKTATLQPVRDMQQVWQQVPNDGQAHYLKVDEGFASQDGDASYLFTVGPFGETLRFAALPPDLKQSSQVRVRAYAKAQDAGTVLGLAWFVNGVEFIGASPAGWDFSMLPLNQWVALDFVMSDFPALMGGETIDVSFSDFVGSGDLRLTQIELVIDYFPHPERVNAEPESRAPAASITGEGPKAAPASLAPSAIAASLAPSAAPVPLAPSAVPVQVTMIGDPAAQAPKATPANFNDLTARPASLAPVAAPASLAPEADGVAVTPGGPLE